MKQIFSLGLDIGTTTISGVVADISQGIVLARRTIPSRADIPSSDPAEKCQDPGKILQVAMAVLSELLEQFPDVTSIGVTGQMHGIVYLDRKGDYISPLYTWQDQRSADLCPRLEEKTGYRIAPGYGLATHCALLEKGQVSPEAEKLCTIMDYVVFCLCGKENLLMHASNAASLGFFDGKQGQFDPSALEKAGIDAALLPQVTWESSIAGFYKGIAVAVAIGDNQASFLGAVPEPETVALVNFGTGSQISMMTRELSESYTDGTIEVRPFLENSYLLCGSALCGGRAYALLEQFFRSFAARCGLEAKDCYQELNALAEEGLSMPHLPQVATTFCGTRADPNLLGSITQLGEKDFTPAAFAAGTLLGMARELLEMFRKMPGSQITGLAASGNAIRQNPALKKAVEREFGLETKIAPCPEEAAFGAARFAAQEKVLAMKAAK